MYKEHWRDAVMQAPVKAKTATAEQEKSTVTNSNSQGVSVAHSCHRSIVMTHVVITIMTLSVPLN